MDCEQKAKLTHTNKKNNQITKNSNKTLYLCYSREIKKELC